MVEQLICNQLVAGSIPVAGSIDSHRPRHLCAAACFSIHHTAHQIMRHMPALNEKGTHHQHVPDHQTLSTANRLELFKRFFGQTAAQSQLDINQLVTRSLKVAIHDIDLLDKHA